MLKNNTKTTYQTDNPTKHDPQYVRKKGIENAYFSIFIRNGVGKEWWSKSNIIEKIPSEEPDFIFKTQSGKNIGLEITNLIVKSTIYHKEKHEATSALETIANKVCEYFKKNKGISLTLNIDFLDKRKWCARTYKEMLAAAYDPGFRHLEASNNEIKQKIIDAFSQGEITPNGLEKRSIEVGSQIFNITATRWNEPLTGVHINNAGICKEDPFEDVQSIINAKNDKYKRYLDKCDKCDLLVVSDTVHKGNFAYFTNKITEQKFNAYFKDVYLLDLGFDTKVIKLNIEHI